MSGEDFFNLTPEKMAKEVHESKLYRISCEMNRVFTRSGDCEKWQDLSRHYEYVKANPNERL